MSDPSLEREALVLFEEALEHPAAEREAFVAKRGAGRDALVRRVRGLLAEESSGSVLGPLELPAGWLQEPDEDFLPPGTRVAGFRIEGVLGSGGMGHVYDARQDTPGRRIALKTLRRGLDSSRARQRFALEAELLAHLKDPGIAQVFDAGVASVETTGGARELPYIAMEFIEEAVSIVEHVRHRALDERSTVRLFLQVCHAVQHGHQRGVIHRDLKPGNVLVDGSGRARVIDFGVSRVTEIGPETPSLETAEGQVVGTPAYMAPEQVELSPRELDTRIDVYALGAILYELLCGRPPFLFAGEGLAKTLRTVVEQEPPRPRSIRADLAPDLEAILEKALRKQRDERYSSASALALDLERFLRHETIEAKRSGVLHQLRLFARRNRAIAAGLGIAVAGLVVATTFSTVSARKERRARTHALRSWNAEKEARAEAETYMRGLLESNLHVVREIASDIAGLDGSTALRAEVLENAVTRLEAVELEAVDDPEILEMTARSYVALGHALGGPMHDNVGDREGARKAYEGAEKLLERLTHDEDATDGWTIGRAQLASELSQARSQLAWADGRLEEGLALAEEAASRMEPLLPTEPFDWDVERTYVSALAAAASLNGTLGNHERALELFRKRLGHVERMTRSEPENETGFRLLQTTRVGLATALWKTAGAEEAVPAFEAVIAQWDAVGEREPRRTDALFERAALRAPFAECLIEAGFFEEAILVADEGIRLSEELRARDPNNARAKSQPMLFLHAVGWAHLERAEAAVNAGAEAAAVADDLQVAVECFTETSSMFEELERAGVLRAVERENAEGIERKRARALELLGGS